MSRVRKTKLASVITLICLTAVFLNSAAAMGTDPIYQIPGEMEPIPPPPYVPEMDWTKDTIHTLYISGMDTVNTRLPFFVGEGPAAVDLNLGGGTASDNLPSEGWRLVAYDFGSEESDTGMPFFLLYNKYNGTLRYIFYNTKIGENYSHGIVRMGHQEENGAAALLSFGHPDYFLDNFEENKFEDAIVKLGPMQWCYADFVVLGYDDNIPENAAMTFWLSGVDETEVELDGKVSLTQVMKVANVSGQMDAGELVDNFKKGYTKYKNTTDAIKGLGKSEGALADYLRPILDSPIADAVPYLSAASGLVNAFIGGKPKQMTPMKFDGSIAFKGKLTTLDFLNVHMVRVPGAPLSDSDDPLKPLYNTPLGLFNMVTKPVLVVDHIPNFDSGSKRPMFYGTNTSSPATNSSTIIREIGQPILPDMEPDPDPISQHIKYYLREIPEVLVNPYLDSEVDIEVGISLKHEITEYFSLESYTELIFEETIPPLGHSRCAWNFMSIQLNITPRNGSYEDPIVVNNRYWMQRVNAIDLD